MDNGCLIQDGKLIQGRRALMNAKASESIAICPVDSGVQSPVLPPSSVKTNSSSAESSSSAPLPNTGGRDRVRPGFPVVFGQSKSRTLYEQAQHSRDCCNFGTTSADVGEGFEDRRKDVVTDFCAANGDRRAVREDKTSGVNSC
ncbi:hypothetical protein MJO29_011279 [Puccinia striiformis f. sp. tritici]|nr:hypothetical protein MJO29_011271 [Puccinia striiformis f. sp. tritici]KAI7946752.1 hypothetical protein MJO29_011279 [Puccinia striiformis f. sp. tritici]